MIGHNGKETIGMAWRRKPPAAGRPVVRLGAPVARAGRRAVPGATAPALYMEAAVLTLTIRGAEHPLAAWNLRLFIVRKVLTGMKLSKLAVLAAMLSPLACGAASATTASDLLQSCKAAPLSAKRGAKLDIPLRALPCWYYMSSIQDMSVLVDPAGHRLLGICPPPNSDVLDFVKAFVRSARRRDVDKEDNAAAAVVPALARQFPCGNEQRASAEPH